MLRLGPILEEGCFLRGRCLKERFGLLLELSDFLESFRGIRKNFHLYPFLNDLTTLLRHTMSYDFARSTATSIRCCLLFIAPQISACKYERRSKVEWFCRKLHLSLSRN